MELKIKFKKMNPKKAGNARRKKTPIAIAPLRNCFNHKHYNFLLNKRSVSCLLAFVCFICLLLFFAVLIINGYVTLSTKDNILTPEEAAQLGEVDCILVLGCLVRPDGSPSHMLADRVTVGIELYMLNAAPKLLMSGDHGREDYNEVGAMKECAVNEGVASSDVFMDHAGFSTYESMYRAKEIFGADKIIIVSQEYHLYRALYVAEALGIEAYGVSVDCRSYSGQFMRDIREVAARVKDFIAVVFKPEPTYLGEPISIEGDGDVTND